MKRWYVLQVYAGYEDQIKSDLDRRINDSALKDELGRVLIPSAKMKQMFGADQDEDQQLFPGYVLVEMGDPRSELLGFVLQTPKILRFLGGKNPVALSKKEVDNVFNKIEGGVVLSDSNTDLAVDVEVTVADGPFSGFVGVIEKIDPDAERLTVMVSIFGRMTPVELRFDQVKK